MLPPLIQRRESAPDRTGERGVTIALVALAIVSIIAMAGLSIDIGTLYQASAEAQRAADVAALSAARVLSLSGMTGDPTNLSGEWNNACNAATTTAQTVAAQNTVGGRAPSGVTVTFSATDGSGCGSQGSKAFGVNPVVTVQVTQASLPVYFARIWGRTGTSVTATATAEAFNPSNSDAFSSSAAVVPVQPRCVKPIFVPNIDPGNGSCTGGTCKTFIGGPSGSGPTISSAITNGGIEVGGGGTGVIGETFTLTADCTRRSGTCNPPNPAPGVQTAGTLQYLPGQVLGTPTAVPSCATANSYQEAIAGCDQSTPYECGVLSSSATNVSYVNLGENPTGPGRDIATAMDCLTNPSGGVGDSLTTAVYPYQITAGPGNPLGGGNVITTSNSIVTIPIFYTTQSFTGSGTVAVTVIGFLQVFVNDITRNGNLNVTVLNVAGCGNGVSGATQALNGTSPVPIRLITPP
jgi:Flp pilus assembly protein TadG